MKLGVIRIALQGASAFLDNCYFDSIWSSNEVGVGRFFWERTVSMDSSAYEW